MNDLQALLLRLHDAGIEFVLVGGYAAMLHGSSLLTRDLDVCVALTPETIERLREANYSFTLRTLRGVPHRLGMYYELTGEDFVKFLLQDVPPASAARAQ